MMLLDQQNTSHYLWLLAAAPKLPIVYVANVAIYFLRPVAGARPGDAIYIFASVCNISIENININCDIYYLCVLQLCNLHKSRVQEIRINWPSVFSWPDKCDRGNKLDGEADDDLFME